MKFKTLNYVNVEADIVHITLEGGALFGISHVYNCMA